MSASNHPRADFDRTCATCTHCVMGGISPRCTVAKHLVTGKAIAMDAIAARSPRGHCGPAGKRWEAADAAVTTVKERRNGVHGATVVSALILAVMLAWGPAPAAAQYAPVYPAYTNPWDGWTNHHRHRRHYHRHHHYDDGCKARLTREGDQYASEAGARAEAEKAWQQAARWNYGEKYMDIKNADDVKFMCSRSSVGSVAGNVFHRCEITAKPCKPDRR